MVHFVILLPGSVTPTARLRNHIKGARVIAADSGIKQATLLNLQPELWVGDFDSAASDVQQQYAHIPCLKFPVEKNATDGALAITEALARRATKLTLLGGLGGQADHVTAHLGLMLALAGQGIEVMATIGTEEAYPLLAGQHAFDFSKGRVSIVAWSALEGITLANTKYKLEQAPIALGDTRTLSNEAEGELKISLAKGYGILFLYPPEEL